MLRACQRHDVEPVLLCNSGAYDSGRVQVPPGGTVIRVDEVTNVEDCLAALHRAGLADREFLAVQTTWEYAVTTAAVLGRALGIRTIDPGTALYFRDKSLQKARLKEAGVPVTRTVVVEDLFNVQDVPLEFERAVLKPIAGGGTTSTSVVTSRADLEAASRAARLAKETSRTFLLEEYVEGDEWMAEGVAFGGKVLFFGLGAYTSRAWTPSPARSPSRCGGSTPCRSRRRTRPPTRSCAPRSPPWGCRTACSTWRCSGRRAPGGSCSASAPPAAAAR
ncbi:hypothetical protein K7G98_06635 [Saccharothrix sp. MB29]|nr:hypothetical protein [Saccharothrix sp. MB29]